MNKIAWLYMYMRKKIIMKLFRNKFWRYCLNKKKILSIEDGNKRIYELLANDAPCMIARFGAVEMRMVTEYQKTKIGLSRSISKDAMNQLCECAGFFPNDSELMIKFSEEMMKDMHCLDMLGVWNVSMEEYNILANAAQTDITHLVSLEPWYCDKLPWSKALGGKKVLVIHPFAETIKKQYKKGELLFPNTDILPSFELHTLKAVQTIAGQKDERFSTWFEALNYMYNEAMKIDFDVAILGCGAYGFPLAAMLKKAGKKVVHLGGATQLLFGIKGKRWDDMPQISKLYNENWVRPDASETPEKSKNVENGCYW